MSAQYQVPGVGWVDEDSITPLVQYQLPDGAYLNTSELAAGGATPKGPLGMPLSRPLGGPL